MKEARERPDKVVFLYEDECTIYRQPSQAWLWSWMGRRQPRMKYSSRNNTRLRIVGFLDAVTGAVRSQDLPEVNAQSLARQVAQVSTWYPDAETIYLAWDNWPNHDSAAVRKTLEQHPRVKVLPLPTYAPWLNAIEKVWKYLRQRTTHAHPWCDHFLVLRDHVRAELALLADRSPSLLRYVGLST